MTLHWLFLWGGYGFYPSPASQQMLCCIHLPVPEHENRQPWSWAKERAALFRLTRSQARNASSNNSPGDRLLPEGKMDSEPAKILHGRHLQLCPECLYVYNKGLDIGSSIFMLQTGFHRWEAPLGMFWDFGPVTSSPTTAGQFHELSPGVCPQVPEWPSCFCELSVYTSCRETVLLIAADSLKQHTSLTHHCFCLWKGSICY